MSATALADGKYALGDLLGQGGSARVFRARRLADAQEFAAKIIPIGAIATPLALLARYRRIAQLQHRHILPILEVGISGEVLFVISPLAEQGSMRQLLGRAQLDLEPAVRLICQIADALQYVHDRGILHLDVKPANILLATGPEPMLGDFDLMQPARESAGRRRVRGTPAYMAPEQCTLAPTGPSTDQYALAVMSFELLTGRRPFMASSPDDLLRRHIAEPPPLPSVVRPGLPREVDSVLLKGLAKDPRQRFPCVRELALALASAMADAPSALPPPPRAATNAGRTLDVVTDVVTVEVSPRVVHSRL